AALPVQLMAFSAHKLYGPKGIGALYVRARPRLPLDAQMHGGGHERGLRSGTLPTHQIVGIGEAFRLAALEGDADRRHAEALRERLWQGLAPLGGLKRNDAVDGGLSTILNVTVEGVEGESLLLALDELAVSSGSACTSATAESSYVLRALGRPDHLAASSVRLSVGRFTTAADIDAAIECFRREVPRLRALAGAVVS
ncbi:MAG: aminotransferase class V-fold PLP-dependent enzyme, partial [Pseudomonadota bacterium]